MAQLHLVVDTKGAGRVVGVFHDPDRATRILAIDPNYFRVVALEADTINPAAIEWLPAPKRELLRGA
jgi:hypothetical protein